MSAIRTGLDSLFKASIFIRNLASQDKRVRAAETKPFDSRADINAPGGAYSNVLDVAARKGHDQSPTIKLPLEFSTVNYEAQDEKIKSEYQVLWSNTMDEGKYKSSSTYRSVNVLFLCWAEISDDLEIKEEVSKLRDTFEKRFNYRTQTSYLDRKLRQKVQVQVNSIVASFIGLHDDPTTLLIVYYAGHGSPGSYYGSPVLHG